MDRLLSSSYSLPLLCTDLSPSFLSLNAGETALTLILRRCAADSTDSKENGLESRREGRVDDSDDDISLSMDGESAGESESKSRGQGKGRGRGSRSSYQQWAIAADLLVRSGTTRHMTHPSSLLFQSITLRTPMLFHGLLLSQLDATSSHVGT